MLHFDQYSEQTVKSVHHDLKKTWAKFKIKDLDHSLYGEQLLKAICMYLANICRETVHMIYIVCVSIHKLYLFLSIYLISISIL